MSYQELKAGDVRKPDDQVRRHDRIEKGAGSYGAKYKEDYPREFQWDKVSLVGHPILRSDLMVAEFRRPV